MNTNRASPTHHTSGFVLQHLSFIAARATQWLGWTSCFCSAQDFWRGPALRVLMYTQTTRQPKHTEISRSIYIKTKEWLTWSPTLRCRNDRRKSMTARTGRHGSSLLSAESCRARRCTTVSDWIQYIKMHTVTTCSNCYLNSVILIFPFSFLQIIPLRVKLSSKRKEYTVTEVILLN